MKTLADQFVYEDYSKQHYAEITLASAIERCLRRGSPDQPSAVRQSDKIPLLRSRLAYVVVITILVMLTVSRVVAAMTAGGAGGSWYLVR
jgi:hypothetical protein